MLTKILAAFLTAELKKVKMFSPGLRVIKTFTCITGKLLPVCIFDDIALGIYLFSIALLP